MAPPATKRRKLEHSDSENESDGSFSGFDNTDGVQLDENLNDSDPSMNGDDQVDNDSLSEDNVEEDEDASEDGSDEEEAAPKNTSAPAVKAATKSQPHKRPNAAPEDGVYTAETFKSNIFKLQVDELLDQSKLSYGKKEGPAENAMRTLKTIIEQIPNREALSVVDAEKKLKSEGVAIPFPHPRPPKDAMYKLQYEYPASVNATGSYPRKTATRSDKGFSIDLVVTMPKSLLQEKDYLNHRYFYKRAYYLACLAVGIRSSKHKFVVAFDCLNGNQLQPVLVVSPNGNGDVDDFTSSKCQIRILVALPENVFPQNKLLPSSNCIRPKGNDSETAAAAAAPTPFYNSSVQSDANITAYLKLLHTTATKAEAFKDACILGRLWLKQRGFSSQLRAGGFGNFEWAALMAILLQPNASTGAQSLSPSYSSYQLFKATLQFLARGDLTKKPFIFQGLNITIPKTESAPVVFDGPRGQNILFKMSQWSYYQLRQEAKTTVNMLSDSAFDYFDAAFIIKTDLLRFRYDATVEIPLSAFDLTSSEESQDQQLRDKCRKLYKTLTRALTDRVTEISIKLPTERPWSISAKRPDIKKNHAVLVSFVTDPSNANRTVDHGPSAENKQEAALFRKFWGEKSELRRFKDGSILESVVWTTKDSSASVMEQIVSYALKQHFSADLAEQAQFSGDAFAHLVSAGRIQGASGVAPFLPIMNAFSALEKDIRDMEELPLHLRHLRAADSQLRYTSVEPPTTGHQPASVVLQFEASGRWPDDLCAIQRTKIAFLLRLAELLSGLDQGYGARVGLENPSQPAQNQAFLDVTTSTGFSFRIRIYHDREIALFERQLKDTSLDAASRESAASSLALYKREYIQAPLHSQVLQTLCTRFPALSPAIRLTKQWFASHLLASHFAPELIELLAVRSFVQPFPWPVPSTASSGFLRTLAWIARWDWRHVPLIVDFASNFSVNPTEQASTSSQAMKPADLERLQTRFEAWRRIDPAMNRVVLFAASNLDEDGTTWTDKARPERVVASRLTSLAKAATQAIRADEDHLVRRVNADKETRDGDVLDPEALFVTDATQFDISITVNPKYASTAHKRKAQPQFKNLDLQRSSRPEASSAFLPELFAIELQEVYGDAVIWFYNAENLDSIVGLWNPVVTAQRTWKVKAGWNSEPVKKKDAVEMKANKTTIVHEIKRLGGELVSSIEMKE